MLPSRRTLKERLHIIVMTTFVFEIITLYSLKARLIVARREIIETYSNRTELSLAKDNYVDAFIREFAICDVSKGLIGDPLILSKGDPPV